MNYRLGPLGFPQGVEAGQKKLLNLALADQLAALEWIQENIQTFGGDKTKVYCCTAGLPDVDHNHNVVL